MPIAFNQLQYHFYRKFPNRIESRNFDMKKSIEMVCRLLQLKAPRRKFKLQCLLFPSPTVEGVNKCKIRYNFTGNDLPIIVAFIDSFDEIYKKRAKQVGGCQLYFVSEGGECKLFSKLIGKWKPINNMNETLDVPCLLFFFFLCLLTRTASSIRTACHDSERSALLQFKQSFLIRESASTKPSAYVKVQQWKPDEKGKGDCCAWDGVECNYNTGYVIGLDLSSSFLYGSIDSNSSLFHLLHLRRLNLSDNNFNASKIPSGISNLSRLSLLDLSSSAFSGQIPSQVLKISKLVVLDLSWNDLELRSPGPRNLVEKLTNLKELHLSGVNISSTVPQILGNLSSLVSLSLEDCSLHGELPATIFQLPNLQVLDLQNNPYLTGKFPGFNRSSLVEVLMLANTSFSGELPESIGNLNFLSHLDIRTCNFSGQLPSSIGELTKLKHMDIYVNHFSGPIPSSLANLTQLTYLSLSSNNFSPGTLSWLGNQTKLTVLGLVRANLYGKIPPSLGNLTQLTLLSFAYNQLTGQFPSWLENLGQLTYLSLAANQLMSPIPFWLGNLTQLTILDLGQNKLQGEIPQSIFNLGNLRTLYLHANQLNGTLRFESFLNLGNLIELQLSGNYLSLLTNITINRTVSKFRNLGLAFCNLPEFPDFLREQDKLEILELSGNKIHGQIPKWVWEMSKESLSYLGLSSNFLTGFDQPISSMTNLRMLNLYSNNLQGSIPIPPPSIFSYSISNNSLTGEFSPLLCNLSSLAFLDLSSNNISGMLPQCLANLSVSLLVLDLRNNSFFGSIPQLCMKGSQLRMIDFNQNQFQGQLPRSLANCDMLETLNMGNNQLNDTFPFWLGKLPGLRILILRRNQFHGTMEEQTENVEFPRLQIIDLSFNRFTGNLMPQQFQNWINMKVVDAGNLSYLQASSDLQTQTYNWDNYFTYSVTISSKGTETDYEKIQEFLVAIDFSSNSFEGCIPENIGNLKALRLLNLSNNVLSCRIPPSLGNLSNLESLDLSHNNLSGEIPMELLQLTFLGFLNVSQNNLTGQIPQGNQFATFESNSFGSNPGLCGKPLSKTCTSFQVSPPPLSSEEDRSREPSLEFDWKIILMGYGGGLVNGLAIGHIYAPNIKECIIESALL
ncbi:receptor-like protein 12 [Durio zibethinus]|uniref:Receptor-like protein 12 n=1 Tax=Durio zibethinus TaxID=66656 RepID=A0A6P5XJB1_DURZI|nr:receptor-like protein 12 [Durio zibethinus]